MTADPAMQAAFADMTARAEANAAIRARVEADPRFIQLDEFVEIFKDPAPRHGEDGFDDVVATLMSARHWRTLRAKSLRAARRCQIANPAAVGFWLGDAAHKRKTEKMHRAADRREMYRGLILGAAGYDTASVNAPAMMAAE